MNTSSIKEIHEHLKHQTHKSTFNPEIPKHGANNPFVILIVGVDLVHPKFRSQPRLLARPNSTTGPSIHERKREREPAIMKAKNLIFSKLKIMSLYMKSCKKTEIT